MARTTTNPAWALLFALVAGACATATAQVLPDPQNDLSARRRNSEAVIHALPRTEKHHITDIFRLQVRGKSLVLRAEPGPDDFRTQRAQLDGFQTPTVFTFTRLVPDEWRQIQFEITIEEYPDPDSFSRLHVLSRPHMLQFDRTSRSEKGMRRMVLSQSPGLVRLNTFDASGNDQGLGSVTISEPDFVSLRRLHPRETEHWLRPLFQDLRQEAAMAPDPMTIWEVLADEWPVDPNVAEQVRTELQALDDADFHRRDAAVNRLARLGREAALAAARLDRHGLDAEQNLRLDALMARFAPVPLPEARRLRGDLAFLLDCLYSEDPLARRLASERLRQVTGVPIPFDSELSSEARGAAVRMLRQKLLGVQEAP